MDGEEFVFNDADHSYWLGTRQLPSVTQILDRCGLISSHCKDEEAAARGVEVHALCALLAMGALDDSLIPDELVGYVNSFNSAWVPTVGLASGQRIVIEKPNYHAFEYYAGTPDIILNDTIIDLKSGTPAKWHRLQTAAYAAIESSRDQQIKRRETWYLSKVGKYPFVEIHKQAIDTTYFYSCLNVYHMQVGEYA